jgi:hypothetical protein
MTDAVAGLGAELHLRIVVDGLDVDSARSQAPGGGAIP